MWAALLLLINRNNTSQRFVFLDKSVLIRTDLSLSCSIYFRPHHSLTYIFLCGGWPMWFDALIQSRNSVIAFLKKRLLDAHRQSHLMAQTGTNVYLCDVLSWQHCEKGTVTTDQLYVKEFTVKLKFCHHLLTVMMFQTCMTYLLFSVETRYYAK